MDQFKSNYERSIKIPGQRPSQLDVGQLELRPERHLGKQRQAQEQPQALAHAHRRLLGFFYVYAILIASLYLTYAAYYFYQQHQLSRLQLVQPSSASQAEPLLSQSEVDLEPKQQVEKEVHFEPILLNEKLEGKLHLLERYVEMIAIDLQETKAKLREREKCDCALSCTFNGTQYADRSSWSNQCDICTCQVRTSLRQPQFNTIQLLRTNRSFFQSGKISCTPQKCPKTNCDDPIQLPGQCCPTCMSKYSFVASSNFSDFANIALIYMNPSHTRREM